MTPVRRSLMDLWEQLYKVQVLVVAMDPDLLDQERFISEWGAVVEVVQTREDVFAHVERVRKG